MSCITIGPKELYENSQALIFVTSRKACSLKIVVSPNENFDIMRSDADQFVALEVTPHGAKFTVNWINKCEEPIEYKKLDNGGIEENTEVTYWFSYNGAERELKYGKGYAMVDTTIMKTSIKKPKEKENDPYDDLFSFKTRKYVSVLFRYEVRPEKDGDHPSLLMQRTPLTVNQPPTVVDCRKANLFDLDDGTQLLSSMLPVTCKTLYESVKALELETELNPRLLLVDAIRYSLETEVCSLNKMLKDKVGEFDDDEKSTYLRVTLGPDIEISPGVPYVLEIWPKGHNSPIHEHGGTCAIIKVLHGSIHITNFNKLTHPERRMPTPLIQIDANAGDVVWIDPNWYQCHKLENVTDDYCATIQCYMYPPRDRVHYPGFDYILPSDKSQEPEIFLRSSCRNTEAARN